MSGNRNKTSSLGPEGPLAGSRGVFVNGEAQWGGAEKVFSQSVEAAVGAGADVRVVLFSEGPLECSLKQRGVSVSVLPLPPLLASWGRRGSLLWKWPGVLVALWRTRRALYQWMKRERPDFIVSNSLKTHLLLSQIRPQIPVVWHLHDMAPRGWIRWLLKFLPGPFEALANSQMTLDSWSGEGLIERGEVVYNGVPSTPSSVPMATAVPTSTLHVGLVATYARWKGHRRFLDAIVQLGPLPHVHFSIIGGPIYRTKGSQWSTEDLQQMIRERGLEDRVTLAGFQDKMALVYRKLDIAVHASEQPEPFGMVIAEALQAGVPCIVSRSGAQEILEGAVLEVEAGVGSLARAMERLLLDSALRHRLGEKGREMAERVLSEPRFRRDWNQRLESVVARHQGMKKGEATIRYAVGFRRDLRLSMENFGWGMYWSQRDPDRRLFFPEGRGEPGAVGRRWLYPRQLAALGPGQLLHLVDHSYADCLAALEGQYQGVCVTLSDVAFWKTRNAKNLWVRKRILHCLQNCSGVVAISSATKKEAEELQIPIQRVILPGFFTDRFPHSTQRREKGRLLHVGGTGPRKGIDRLLRLLAALPIPYHLVHVGEPMTLTQIQLARELGVLGRIQQLGQVPELRLSLLYASAQVVVVPSRYEGFGMPVVEARLVGTPVVSSADIPAVAELKGDPGVATLDWDGPPATGALQALRVGAMENREQWDWKRRMQEYEEVYEGLLSSDRRHLRSA